MEIHTFGSVLLFELELFWPKKLAQNNKSGLKFLGYTVYLSLLYHLTFKIKNENFNSVFRF